jgi:hypothetical protein
MHANLPNHYQLLLTQKSSDKSLFIILSKSFSNQFKLSSFTGIFLLLTEIVRPVTKSQLLPATLYRTFE